jgi:hypothetical protein
VLLSFLMLFTELTLIRWSGANVVYLSLLLELRSAGQFSWDRDRIPQIPLKGATVSLGSSGSAFLLLETKSVVQFALLFGTTWFVNALVFAGILITVLAAIEIARRFSFGSPGRLYLALAAGLTLAWVVSPEQLLSLSVVPRFLAATAVAFAPVFVANLIFGERFRGVGSSVVAFGANLLGAMVGGLLEYGALVVGYRGLLLVVAGLYSLAFVFRSREATRVPVAEAATGHRPGTDLLDTAAKGDPSTAF